MDWSWETPEERQAHVVTQHARGRKLVKIAECLGVDERTVRRDCEMLGLETWSSLTDDELNELVLEIIAVEHAAVGLAKIESHLIRLGYRVQQIRIRCSMVNYIISY
jgi:hypothetical protein